MSNTERAAADRELFEKWHIDTYMEEPLWDAERNLYVEFGHHSAWKGFQAGRASRAQEAPALLQSDVDAMRKMQEEYDSLAERWREARPYSQEVANLHATFKAFDSRLGKLIEGGLFKRVLGSVAATPPLPAAPEQPPSLKSTPYGPAILLDDVRDAERMDWLERQDLNDIAMIRQTNGVIGINVGSGPFYGKTLRAAIDAARAAAPKEPTP